MKKYLVPLIVLVILAGVSCQETIDIEKEKEAIKAVIEEESNAFYARDFDRMTATYVQDETNVRLTASESGYGYTVGAEELNSGLKEYWEAFPEPVENPEVKTNYNINVYKDCAWAIYDSDVLNDEGESTSKSIHVQFLEKVEGEWKIVYFSIIATSSWDEAEEDVEGEMEEGEEVEGETEQEEME